MVIVMATLVAQMVAPNTQPGPLRLPAKQPQTTTGANNDPNKLELDQGFELPNTNQKNKQRDANKSDSGPDQQIRIKGELPYDSRLTECAATLTTRLVSDGYINTRVFVTTTAEGAQLELIEGRITEIRVSGASESLNEVVYNELEQLKSGALNIFKLDQKLATIRQAESRSEVQKRSCSRGRYECCFVSHCRNRSAFLVDCGRSTRRYDKEPHHHRAWWWRSAGQQWDFHEEYGCDC